MDPLVHVHGSADHDSKYVAFLFLIVRVLRRIDRSGWAEPGVGSSGKSEREVPISVAGSHEGKREVENFKVFFFCAFCSEGWRKWSFSDQSTRIHSC